jgi:hypothetical protein
VEASGHPTESRLAGKFSFTPEPVNRLVFPFPFLLISIKIEGLELGLELNG